MNKNNFNTILTGLLICFVSCNCFGKVTKIIDEKDILKVTGQYSATPAGLVKTSYGTFIFFEKSIAAVMEYNPADKQLNIIADEDSLKSSIIPSTSKQKKSTRQKSDAFRRPTTLCFDLDVDENDNIYAIISDKADSNQINAVQIIRQDGRYNLPEKIAKISDQALCICLLQVDNARKQLIILMDTYKGADDPSFNGIYTLGIAGNTAGLKCFKSFGQIGQKVTPMLIAGDKPIGGTGLAIQGDNLYWHLTVGPANGNGADGDLVMINLITGKIESALDRERLISDIGPEGLGQDGNFYFTTFDIDGNDLFMMVNVGVTDRAQNIHHYRVDGNEFEYLGVAAYDEEILQAGNQLGIPLIVYSTECEAKDGKFYIFTASNLVENLMQITPDYNDPPVVRVAVYSGPGGDGFSVYDALKTHPDIFVKKVSPKDIRDGILKDFDVIIQPGGSGSGQGKALQPEGCKAVKDFVSQGHGYIGICAGAYLASSGYEWSLGIMNAIVIEREHWNRGGGDLAVELTPEGRRIICDVPDTVEIRYGQGALYAPAGRDDLPAYRVLAYYRETISELTNAKESVNGAVEGVMNGVPAIATGEYGKGRVVTISPHPESKGSGLEFFIHNLARFVAKERPTNRADMLDKPQQDCVKYVQRNYQKTKAPNVQACK